MKSSFLFLPVYILFSCGTSKVNEKTEAPIKDSVQQTIAMKVLPKDTVIMVGKTPIAVKSPDGEIKADILVLPGWNFPKEKICNESDFCTKALARGYRLILPDMMKSVYASHYYPETRKDYKNFLTLTWVTDTMISQLKSEYQLLSGKNNYLHGISTGARGAAMIHLSTGNLFTKVALLSGDYDQAQTPDDNLIKNVYGPYAQFKERWEKDDNPVYLSDNWTADLYIAHGTLDDVVEVTHSKKFADILQKKFPDKKIITHFPEAKHDFAFWGNETEAILAFFEAE